MEKMVNVRMNISRKIFFVFMILTVITLLFGMSASAINAADYAPFFYFEAEEDYFPVDVDYHLTNCDLYQYDKVGDEEIKTLVKSNPSVNEIASYTNDDSEYSFLDNKLGNVDDDSGILGSYRNYKDIYGFKIYYFIEPGSTSDSGAIQYWMFYAFNKGDLNRHEGDWEMVRVEVDSDGYKQVGYSQHHSGQKGNWQDVEKEGNHINVYVSRGSHANYLRSYSGTLGLASDIVGANGFKLRPGEYELEELNTQGWLNYNGRWGEFNSLNDEILGRNGPPGPMFREDMYGNSMWEGSQWSDSLPAVNGLWFSGEWFLYHFVTILIIITVISLVIIFVRIYLRHKKHGLGPRILSMLYIDGINLKSIGNILCFVSVIIAFLGLIYPWYSVSADVNVENFNTGGLSEIISIDGLEGLQLTIPGSSGSVPLGNVNIPFSLVLAIGIIFMIFACIGIHTSRKLGWKYLYRGIKLLVPVIILIVIIVLIGSLIGSQISAMGIQNSPADDVMETISNSPLGGNQEILLDQFFEEDITADSYLGLQWGLGSGAYLLLFGSILFIVSGVIEVMSNTEFFKPRNIKIKDIPKSTPPTKKPQSDKPVGKRNFCPKCGGKLVEGNKFCTKCGFKINE